MSFRFPEVLDNEPLCLLPPNIGPIINSYGSMFEPKNIVLPPGVLSTKHSHGCMFIPESVIIQKKRRVNNFLY